LLTILGVLAFTPGGLPFGLATLVLAWCPLREVVFLKGRGAVRHIEWSEAGEWRIGPNNKDSSLALLLNESAVLGPWVFLIWLHEGRRKYAIVDAPTFRAFRGRLRLERT
jgi:hypothetical protein